MTKIEQLFSIPAINKDTNFWMIRAKRGFFFDEFVNSDMDITVNYLDQISLTFECKRIGIEESNKQINRKTPILLSASGYSREGKTRKISKKDYIVFEENNVNNLEKVLKGKFSKYVGDFFE